MSDWSHGYNVSLGYTYGFYRELAPDWLDLCARVAGYTPPSRTADGAFRYLELGSGQGVGLCLLAGANPDGEFVGIDFNPEHIAHARGLAIAAGLDNVRFIEGDFAALGEAWPEDLGQFEYVVLHGIYSWIPATVRHSLVQCLDHACPPGGLVYNSYNSKPGWVSTMPFQHMARRLQVTGARPGPQAIDDAVALFEQLGEQNSAMFRALPTLKSRVQSVRTQNRAYLVQEYLHENWHPMWFSEVTDEFAEAKLNYLGTATIAELMLPGLLPAKTRDIVNAQQDLGVRQEVQDCAINQGFRRDLFSRGARKLFGGNLQAAMDTVFHLISAPTDDEKKISTSFGEVSLKRKNFGSAVAALESGPKTLRELLALPDLEAIGNANAIQNILLLVHAGSLGIGRQSLERPEVAQRLNLAMAAAVCAGAPYGHFAVPALGSALSCSDIDAMLLDAWAESPDSTVDQLAEGLQARLARLGRGLAHEGKPLKGDALSKRLVEMATNFRDTNLPRWQKLAAVA